MPSIIVPTTSGWQVLRRSIRFHGGRELFFEDLVFASAEPSLELDERMRSWRVRGIQDVFLLISDPALQRFASARMQAAGRSVTVLPSNIDQMPPAELRQVNMHLLSRLAHGNAVLVASRELAEQARILMTTLVMTPPGSKIAAADAVKLVAGRGFFETMDRSIAAYYSFLHGKTTAPAKTPSPPRTKEVAARPVVTTPPAKQASTTAPPEKVAEAKTIPAVQTAIAPAPIVPVLKAAPAAGPGSTPPKEAAKTPAPAAEEKETAPTPAPATEKQPAPAAKVEPQPGVASTKAAAFKSSRFSIRVKLLGIISGIIVSALLTMILLASQFFKDDSETRIKENSLNLTEVIGLKVESELEDISYRAQLAAATLEDGDKSGVFTELFLRNNQNFVFVGIGERQGQSIHFTKTLYNERFLTDHSIKRSDLERIHTASAAAFQKSLAGAVVVQNMSPGFSMPLLGMSLPSPSGRSVIVLYIDPAQFLKTFKASGITLTFLVGDNGDVIAHPEQEMVMSRTNLADSEIVKQMLESRSNNQQVSFKDKAGKRFIGNFKKLNFAGLGVISTVPEDDAFQAVYRIRYRNFLIMVLVVVAAIFIVYFFSKTITVPIRSLVGATKQVEEGNYHLSLRPSARDEIGLLTNSFVNMALGLEERQKMKDALGKFTNPKIAEMVLSGQLKLGGDKKNAAVFFSDLRGFTAMSESMEPEEVVEFLNEYFTGMVACVDRTNGVVDKFIGDAIMAHWGALFSDGNDTENAVNAALQMRQNLVEFNSRDTLKTGKKKPHAQFGCGINTGPVISGQIGSESRLDYTVIGDSVNLASRIEALNKPFGTDVLISSDSYEVVKDVFDVVEMPAIKVKGKAEPQVIYCVLGRKDDPTHPKTVDELRARIGMKFSGQKPSAEALDGEEVKYEILSEKGKSGT